MTSNLRPDERATQSDIERSKRQTDTFKSGLSTAANIATTVAGAGLAAKGISSLSSKIMPFLNEYIPTELAIKGISKVSPEIGAMLNKGMSQGLGIEEGIEFLKNQLSGVKKESEEKPPENMNIIQKYSDNLHQYISGLIKNGTPPLQAAAKAKKFLDKSQLDIINKIEKDYKTDFGDIVESIFGKGDMAQKPSPTEMMESKMAKFSQPREQNQQSQPMQTQQPQERQPFQGPGINQQLNTKQSNPQALQQLKQAMQDLSNKLRT